ncbi:MAG: methyltransferase domain-containing protein [Candidatus Poribacteria bacterium]|nr:methyltransferase domain-containing protein [Candidatus Poribacteria bacterium]
MQNAFVRFLKARKGSHGNPRYPRKLLDEILEYLRFTKVEPYIPESATLLDIGAGDGNFLRYLNGHLQSAVGIDSHLKQTIEFRTCYLVPGVFPYDFKRELAFDVITMMAVAEHIPMEVFPDVAQACWKYLKPGGQVIITVQHPRVEGFLDLLKDLRIVEGFSMHEHYGFDPECLREIFNRWTLIKRERWGFGCNNLFIFKKP